MKEIKEVEIEEKKVIKEGLTFDIFHEAIFDEEEEDSLVKEEVHINEEFNIVEADNIINDEIVSEEIKFSDEGLEFFGEEELVKEEQKELEEEKNVVFPSNPFVEETIKVEEEKPVFEEEISDIYSLLKENNENNAYVELKDEVEINCDKINQKLNELNIKASVNNYIIGPCVTRYEIVPEIGVRVSSIVNIENDLKLALAAVKTRMEAPIPGKSAVGIEVANKKRYPVYLKEVILPFKDDDSKLLVGIGRDLNNKEIVFCIDVYNVDVARMYQKDDSAVDRYEHGGVVHQILQNYENTTVVWSRDNIECQLVSNCQVDTLHEILKSIYIGG